MFYKISLNNRLKHEINVVVCEFSVETKDTTFSKTRVNTGPKGAKRSFYPERETKTSTLLW